ncbi:cyclic nucleotide-binding domain-containing protein [Terricaulis sp.]|uniref:cyclic nucleotide-binding domain-containing protein n=1 Tax=Terricaulis sp. TaxID=2768686 RepID=UPI00378345C8
MRPYDLERCRALPLFANTQPDTLRELTAGAHVQRFPSGTLLLLEGDAVDFLYVLLEGQVELHGTWNDQETVLAVLQPVSTFILAAVVLDADALMSARTLERCEILMIPGDAIRKAMVDDVQFGAAVAKDLAGGFRTMVRAVKNQKLRSGVERLANYLVMLKASDGGVGANVILRHEKRILASLLGMTPENLSRAFAALRKHGVSVNGSVVTISNPAALRALAKPDPLIDNHAPRGGEIVTPADAEVWSTQASRSDFASRAARGA